VGPNPRPGVLLDRDGVINDVVLRDGRSYPPPSIESLKILPGVASALHSLKRAGLPLIVVTNQPDVGRGSQTQANVEAIHTRLRASLPLDSIEVCFHTNDDGCDCRKPRTGMLTSAAARHGLDLGRSFLVGDRWRDIEAGQRVGCTTFWIDRGYNEQKPEAPDYQVSSLFEASQRILELLRSESAGPSECRSTPEINP